MRTHLLLSVASVALSVVGSAVAQEKTLAENKAVVIRSEAELWNNGNLAVADELYSPDYVCHFVVGPEWKGIDGIKAEVKQHRTSFPDWNERVDDVIAEGDKVVIRFTSTGTQRGDFQGIKATGRKVTVQEVAIFRLADGKIVEQRGIPDVRGLMEQLSSDKKQSQ